MTNLDSILKSRDITLPPKVWLVKAMVFPVVIYGCESWLLKKAEHQRIDAFKLWCWRKLLRVPWNARRSNQSILKEISPEYSLEGLMLKLKLQYSGHLTGRTDSFEKTLMLERLKAGGEGDDRGSNGWMASPTRWTWVWINSRAWQWTGRPGVLQSMGSQRVGYNWATELNYTVFADHQQNTLSWVDRDMKEIQNCYAGRLFHVAYYLKKKKKRLTSTLGLSRLGWDRSTRERSLSRTGWAGLGRSPWKVHLTQGPATTRNLTLPHGRGMQNQWGCYSSKDNLEVMTFLNKVNQLQTPVLNSCR